MENDENKAPELNTDAILGILGRTDFKTLMTARFLNKNTNDLIMRHRSLLPRSDVDRIIIINSDLEWIFTIMTRSRSIEIKSEEDAQKIVHFQPRKLEFVYDFYEESDVSNPLDHLPEYWFKDIESIYISQTTNLVIDQNYLKKFLNLDEIVIRYTSPFEKLSHIVQLMQAVKVLRIDLLNRNPENTSINCADEDLREITKKCKKLKQLIIEGSGCKIDWKTDTFLEFLKTAEFAENVIIRLEKWNDDPRAFANWLETNTKIIMKTYYPLDRFGGSYSNYLPNFYEFEYRGSSFNLRFIGMARNGQNNVDEIFEEFPIDLQ